MILYFSITSPFDWAIINNDDIVNTGIAETLLDIPIHDENLTTRIMVVPGELVSLHKVTVPVRNRKKALMAIPYLLENTLADQVDNLQFILIKWTPTGESCVAVVAKHNIEEWQQIISELAVPVDQIVPDFALIPFFEESDITLVSEASNDRILVRTDKYMGFSIQSDELMLWLKQMEKANLSIACNDAELVDMLNKNSLANVIELNAGAKFSDWAKASSETNNIINLQQRPKHSIFTESVKNWSIALLILYSLITITKISFDGYQYHQLTKKNQQLDQQVENLFQEAFPKVSKIVDAEVQFKQELAKIKADRLQPGIFQYLLSAVTRALTNSQIDKNVTLTEISFRDEKLLIICSVDTFASLDKLSATLQEQRIIKSQLVSSDSRDGSVKAKYKITLNKQ